MNAEELKSFVEAQGYTHVSVQVYKGSFRVNYWTEEAKYQRRLGISIACLPSNPDGSRWGIWLSDCFPKVN